MQVYLIITHITSFWVRLSMELTVQIRQLMKLSRRLQGKKDNYVIQVSARMQEPQTITGKDIDYHYVSSGEILQLLKTQKPWEWIRGFFETKNIWFKKRLFSVGKSGRNR